MKTILVTGVFGFIGYHTAQRLLAEGNTVVGVDNMNDYYDPELKEERMLELKDHPQFQYKICDINDEVEMGVLFNAYEFDYIVHLAGQAGVRYSLEAPLEYVESNVRGTTHLFELARRFNVNKIVYASSSSVHGNLINRDGVESLYALTKKYCEELGQLYFKLYGVQSVGMRFFTVYGPYGRPDMAYFKFADHIMLGKPIEIYGSLGMSRDFTYIDDIVDGILKCVELVDNCGAMSLDIGKGQGNTVVELIQCLEKSTGKKALLVLGDKQKGDVDCTLANLHATQKFLTGFEPKVQLQEGIDKFVAWHKTYVPGWYEEDAQ